MRPTGKKKRFHILITLIGAILLVNLGLGSSQKDTLIRDERFSINLRAKALVVGPVIKLGDIGRIVMPDSVKRARIAELKIADAAPPGESRELSLNYIKRRLSAAGLKEYTGFLNGPSIIRVTTAQEEINKALLREQFARVSEAQPASVSKDRLRG